MEPSDRERDPLSNEGCMCLAKVYSMKFLGISLGKRFSTNPQHASSLSFLTGGEASKDALSEASVPGELSVPADGPRPTGTLGSTSLLQCLVFHPNLLVIVAVF